MLSILSALGTELATYAPLIIAGIITFALWGVLKAAASRGGSRFGFGAVGGVMLIAGGALWTFGLDLGLALVLGLIGLVILILAVALG